MDSALKQRLVGLAVLIALAVIFLPMFFSSTPPKQENTTIGLNIPPAPERNFETRNLAIDAPGKATPAPTTPKGEVAPADKVTTITTAPPASNEAADKPVAPVATDTKPVAPPLAVLKPAPPPPQAPA